jgi:hypothetical protein
VARGTTLIQHHHTARRCSRSPDNGGRPEATTCRIENEELKIEKVLTFAGFSILNFQFSISWVHRSAQKGISMGLSGGGSQPATTALCALQPIYSLRHSHP